MYPIYYVKVHIVNACIAFIVFEMNNFVGKTFNMVHDFQSTIFLTTRHLYIAICHARVKPVFMVNNQVRPSQLQSLTKNLENLNEEKHFNYSYPDSMRTSQADLHFYCSRARKNNSNDVVHIGSAKRKYDFPILLPANHKDADQPAHPLSLISAFIHLLER